MTYLIDRFIKMPLHSYIIVACTLVMIVSMFVMLSWIFDVRAFQIVLPGLASMKFNTALLFFLSGSYLSLSQLASSQSQPQSRLNLLLIVVLVISTTTMLAYALNITLFLDEFFVSDHYTAIDAYPGRMSFGTALTFSLLSLTLLSNRRYPRISEIVSVIAHFIALTALIGYLFNVDSLYHVFIFNTMALHTAASFVLLTIAAMFVIPDGVISSLLSGHDPGGSAARFLMPIALVLPTSVGLLSFAGVHVDLYDPAFALVLATILSVLIFTLLVLRYALFARASYQRHLEMQTKLLESEVGRIELEKEREIIALKEDFLAMLSHDMRSPLSAIILSSDVLLTYDEKLDVERRVRHLNKIRKQAFSILDLVEDLMLLSESKLGAMPYEPSTRDIVVFCREIFDQHADNERNEGHKLELFLPDMPIEMGFDGKLLKRALNNILRNAIKYSPDGGRITMEVYQLSESLSIAISDTGIGIPKENQKALFTMFHRAANVGNIPGYGLGLVIVKQIVDLHQGSIKVESEEGEGTTFTITLPTRVSEVLEEGPVGTRLKTDIISSTQ